MIRFENIDEYSKLVMICQKTKKKKNTKKHWQMKFEPKTHIQKKKQWVVNECDTLKDRKVHNKKNNEEYVQWVGVGRRFSDSVIDHIICVFVCFFFCLVFIYFSSLLCLFEFHFQFGMQLISVRERLNFGTNRGKKMNIDISIAQLLTELHYR